MIELLVNKSDYNLGFKNDIISEVTKKKVLIRGYINDTTTEMTVVT